MSSNQHGRSKGQHENEAWRGAKENEQKAPRARGTPGSFDQPTPRDEVMPRQGGRPTHQTAEVPLGTGDVSEPPGGGGLSSRRAPQARGKTPSDLAAEAHDEAQPGQSGHNDARK